MNPQPEPDWQTIREAIHEVGQQWLGKGQVPGGRRAQVEARHARIMKLFAEGKDLHAVTVLEGCSDAAVLNHKADLCQCFKQGRFRQSP